MYLTSGYYSRRTLTPIVSPVQRYKAHPSTDSTQVASPAENLHKRSNPILIFVKGKIPSCQPQRAKQKLHIHYPKIRRVKPVSANSSESDPDVSTRRNPSRQPSTNSLPDSREASVIPMIKKRRSTFFKKRPSTSKHVIVEKPVDTIKELAEKLKFFKLKTSTNKTKYVLNLAQSRTKKKADGKKKRMDNQKMEILNKSRILHEMKQRYKKLLAIQQDLKLQHKLLFDKLNHSMTDSLNEVETFDSKLNVVLDIQRNERVAAKKATLQFEAATSKVLSAKKEDLQQHMNDLQEISRIIQELHFLKVNLSNSSDFLKSSLIPIVQSQKELEVTFAIDRQFIEDKINAIKPKEIEKIHSKMKEYIDMKSNKILNTFFNKFTIPLYHTKLNLQQKLEAEKKVQERTLTLINDLERKMKEENVRL